MSPLQEESVEGLLEIAREHWWKYKPKTCRELEKAGELERILQQAAEMTHEGIVQLRQDLEKQGYTPDQAFLTAWELMRDEWTIVPSEEETDE